MPDTTDILKTLFSHCKTGNLHGVRQLVQTHEKPSGIHPGEQCQETGASPLMIAAGAKQKHIVQYLLINGAPWNALDKQGKCAGNYALEAEDFDQRDQVLSWAGELASDTEWLIQKAIATWLSSLSKHDAPRVLSFLEKYGTKMKPFAINESCKFL